jgi:hypothetical protein
MSCVQHGFLIFVCIAQNSHVPTKLVHLIPRLHFCWRPWRPEVFLVESGFPSMEQKNSAGSRSGESRWWMISSTQRFAGSLIIMMVE